MSMSVGTHGIRRLFNTTAVAPRSIDVTANAAKAGSRLEWDTVNQQWIKKPRQAVSARQRAQQELDRQRQEALANTSAAAAAPIASTSKAEQTLAVDEKASDGLTSRQRYLRGQDSSTLKLKIGKTLAGVPIPVRPTPPESTDCCMSGCPRCVYDVYTEDLQIHFEAMDKARKDLRARGVPQTQWPIELRTLARDTPDADGVSSDGDASAFARAADTVTSEIEGLDISLRTFLKFERELRERRRRERMRKTALEHVSSMNEAPTASPKTYSI